MKPNWVNESINKFIIDIDKKDSISDSLNKLLDAIVIVMRNENVLDDVIYMSLPFWSYEKQHWLPQVPIYLSQKLNKYEKLKCMLLIALTAEREIVNITLTESICRNLKNSPEEVIIDLGNNKKVDNNKKQLNIVFKNKISKYEYDNTLDGELNEIIEKVLCDGVINGKRVNEIINTILNNKENIKKYKESIIKWLGTTEPIRKPVIDEIKNDYSQNEFAEKISKFAQLYKTIDANKVIFIAPQLAFRNNKAESSGGIIIALKNNNINIRVIKRLMNNIYIILKSSYGILYGRDHELLGKAFSIRSAASAILSRNFSHHIGSHVMPRANVNDIKKRLNTLYESGLKSEEDIDRSRDISLSVERLKTVLDDFIQKKADFLAEVTTDPNSSSDSKLLGRDILAPLMSNALLMDNIARNEGFGYPIKSPLPATDGEDVLKGWKQGLSEEEKRKLASINSDTTISSRRDRVVGLAPLQWRMRSTLRLSLCVRENGKCHCILGPDLPPYDPFYGLKGINFQPEQFGVKADCTHKDPMIAVPGMVGQFAIYGVLENIIRNAAKHGKKDDKADGLHIHMLIEDDGEDYYKLSIWDDRTEPDIIKITASIPNQPDVKPKERSLGEHLQAWAEADLIDPSGAVRRDAWGVAEIMICANLLAGRRQFDYQRDIAEIVEDYSPHLNCDKVTCEGVDAPSAESAKKRLIYRIRLLKAKRAVFVGKCFTDSWNGNLDSLKKEGVYAFESVDSLREFFKKSEACQAFQFAVFDSTSASVIADLEEKTQEEFLAKLPFRVFEIASSEPQPGGKSPIPRTVCLKTNPFTNSDSFLSADKLMELLWQHWIRDNKKLNPDSKTITNAVYLDCKSDDPPNNGWKDVIPGFNQKPGPVKMYLTSRDNGSVGEHHLADTIHAGFFRHKTVGGINDVDMFEVFGKRNADCDMLLGAALPTTERPFWELPYAMAEAGLVRILVLDERMTERAMTPIKGDSDHGGDILEKLIIRDYTPCFWHLAQRAKVYIATHLQVGDDAGSMKPLHDSFTEAELKHNSATENPRPACPFLKIRISEKGLEVLGYDRYGPNNNGEVAKEPALEFDIVVIHQGIIDTNKPKTEQGNDEETMRHWIMKTHPWLVVESGRGIPPGLQKKPVRFLSFSALDQTLALDGIGKLSLTRRLMALPRFGDNGGES